MDDFGIQKLSVDKQVKPIGAQSAKPMARTSRKRFSFSLKSTRAKIIAGLIVFLVLVIAYASFQAIGIYKNAQKVYTQAKLAAAAAKQQNIALAKEELVKTGQDVTALRGSLSTIGFLHYVPLVNGYYNDADHMLLASTHGINAAIITADSLIPYADVLGLKGDKSFAQGSAEDRIKLAVQTLGKVLPKIDVIEKELVAAKADMDQVNPNRYPNFWKFARVRNQIIAVKNGINDGVLAVDQGKPLIKLLPELMGEKNTKKYLVIFQNDKEQRPTGGFMTFYAVFRVDQGIIHVDSALDIYSLDDSLPNHAAAPPIIAKYLPKVNTFNIRDSNLSPDFVESMKTFYSMYKTSSQKTDIDGIIAIDTHFLVSILKILGDVQAGGLTFNAKNDPRCDCPQVVYVLEDNTTKPVNYIKSNRKGLLAELLFAIMQKALSSSPKLYWGPLIQAAIKDANEKHIMFYLFNPDAQKGIEALNWGGRVKQFTGGDYLYINDANFGGAKSNLFVTNSVRLDYNIDSSGTIKRTDTIIYKNPKPYSDCNLERGGLCLNATLRNFQRVYVPKGSTIDSSKGSQVKVLTKEEFGKTYFESFFTVNPLGKAEITYTYTLPFKVPTTGKLPILIQKQPGVARVPYQIFVNGRQVESFDLVSDKELQLNVK